MVANPSQTRAHTAPRTKAFFHVFRVMSGGQLWACGAGLGNQVVPQGFGQQGEEG